MIQRRIPLLLSLVMVAALVLPAIAQDASTKQPSAAQQAQQQKMKDCNKQASDKQLKGDDRKKFMSDCLSGSPTTTTTANSQQQKMKDCNKQASDKNLKGDDRKTFMSSCLSSNK